MFSAFSRASSAVILPSATASFNFSVIIEVIVEMRSSVVMPLDSAISPRVAPLRIPAAMSAFSIPRLFITAPRRCRPLSFFCFISPFVSLFCLPSSIAFVGSSNEMIFSEDPFCALATNGIAMTAPANNEEDTIAIRKFFRIFLMVI